ncbi:MAG TPA: hypothetical protein VGO70_00555 [Arsenicitalea sp.]|nr:hypothetical protein [Arsenicitalea sp.]
MSNQNRINTNAQLLARGLGWFSLLLGAAELFAPRSIKRQTGMLGPSGLVQGYGAREIATGVAILTSKRPVSMVWARVAGDLLDLATAAPVLRPSNPHRKSGEAAFGFLVLATIADLAVALQGDEKPVSTEQRSTPRLPAPARLAASGAPAHAMSYP